MELFWKNAVGILFILFLMVNLVHVCPRKCVGCQNKTGTRGCDKEGWPLIDADANEVDLSSINFSSCPPDLSTNVNLEKVNLSRNLLKSVNYTCFHKDAVLNVLDLSYNLLTKLPNFTSGAEVQILNLTGNQIVELNPLYLYGLSKVRQLILDDNGLDSFSGNELLQDTDMLEILSLRNNKITRFAVNGTSRLFINAVNLKELYLSNNMLLDRNTPWLLGALNLEVLDLSGAYCSIKNSTANKYNGWSFPGHSMKLQTLDLSQNRFFTIGSWAFSGCLNLERLNLTNCSLTEFKVGQLQDMEKLTHLYVDYNSISNLSSSIFYDLQNLRVLSMEYNNLRSATVSPISLTFTENLETINFSNNNLASLDFLEKSPMTNLSKLYLDNNTISSVRFIKNLPNLRVLSLVKNNLKRIPNINKLTNLHWLNLAANDITVLDFKQFWITDSPVTINLANNQIDHVLRGDLNTWVYTQTSWTVILRGNPLTCNCTDEWFEEEQKALDNNSTLLRVYENVRFACPNSTGTFPNISYALLNSECAFIHREVLVILGSICLVMLCCAILAIGMTIGKRIERRHRTTGGVVRTNKEPEKKLISERDDRKFDTSPAFMIAEKDQHLKDARSLSNLKGSMVRLDNENVKPFFREIYV